MEGVVCYLPSLFWLSFFFVIPTLLVFAIAFKPPTLTEGSVKVEPSNPLSPRQPELPVHSLADSLDQPPTTVICLVLAVPTGYHIARLKPRVTACPFW